MSSITNPDEVQLPGFDADGREVENPGARSQGLLPIMAALAEADLPFEVENTGGNVLAIVISAEPGHIAITAGGEPESAFVAVYPFDSWHTGEEPIEVQDDLAIERVPGFVAFYLNTLADFHNEATS